MRVGSCIHSLGICSPLYTLNTSSSHKLKLGPSWHSCSLLNPNPLLWSVQLSQLCVSKLMQDNKNQKNVERKFWQAGTLINKLFLYLTSYFVQLASKMEGQVICIQQTCSADKVLEAGDRKVSQRSPAPLDIHFCGSVLLFLLCKLKKQQQQLPMTNCADYFF